MSNLKSNDMTESEKSIQNNEQIEEITTYTDEGSATTAVIEKTSKKETNPITSQTIIDIKEPFEEVLKNFVPTHETVISQNTDTIVFYNAAHGGYPSPGGYPPPGGNPPLGGYPQSTMVYLGQIESQANRGNNNNRFGPPDRPLAPDESIVTCDPKLRNEFVRRVFAIVLIMLFFTGACLFGIHMIPDFHHAMRGPLGVLCLCLGLFLCMTVSYSMGCCECARRPPCCYFMLIMIVIGYICLSAFIIVRYKLSVMIYAFLGTAVIAGICLALAFTDFDFTKFLLLVLVASFALFLCAIIILVIMLATGQRLTWLQIAVLIGQTVISSVMLVIELQMILGGKTVELTVDETGYAAFLLYSSIMDLFLKLVQIIGFFDDN